jgi:FLVCR family MFS transporter 7
MNPAEEHHPVVYRTYKARYFGLFAIVLLNIATTFVWLTYSSVPEAAEAYLNCSSFLVSVTSILYFFAFIVMAPVSGWMFEKRGIKKSLLFGAGIQVLGAWLRYFGHFVGSTPENRTGRLVLTLLGQVIAAGAQPFFMNLPPKFAAVWFSENGRTTATMIGTVSNASAAALAQLIIPSITDDTKPETMPNSVLFTAILSTVAIIPAFFVADRPPTPPSPSAAEALQETVEEPFHISLKKVGTNKQFLLLLLVFGSLVGIFNSVTSLLATFTGPYGYTSNQAGYLGAGMVLAGLVGAAVSGPLVDKTKQYKSVCKTAVPVAVACVIGFVFAVRRDFFAGMLTLLIISGFSAFAALPAALELAVEITYPVTPASSTSILWAFGQLVAIIMLFTLQGLQDDELSARTGLNPPLIFNAAWCVVFAIIPVFFINSPYKRLEAEAVSRRRDEVEEMASIENKGLGNEKEEV